MPDSDQETLERRLDAVERALAADSQPHDPEAPARTPNEELAGRLDSLQTRVDELDAALQAVRGFLGGVDAVNERVESRAEAAVAAVERLEHRLEEAATDVGDPRRDGSTDDSTPIIEDTESVPESADRSVGDRLRDQW